MLTLEENLPPEVLFFIEYRRKSSEAEDRQILSLPAQKIENSKYAKANNLNIVFDFEEAQSAYSPGRPEFNKMINLIRKGKANAIFVYHLSRLARNMTDGGIIIDMLKDGIIKEIRTPNEVYRKNSGQEFLLALQFAMQKKSSDDTSEYVKRDIKSKLRKGEYPGYACVGYLNIDKNEKISGKQYTFEKQKILCSKNKLKRIEVDPLLAPIVLELYKLFATGRYALEKLRDTTYEMGLTGDRSKKKLSKATINRILTNPFYRGAIFWKGVIIEPEELPDETRHDPIVSKELFYRVQQVLKEHNRPIGKKRFYTYSNLLRCGVCGGNISGLTSKGHPYYRCMKCKGQLYIREDVLEEQIIEGLKKVSIDEDFYNLAMEEINKLNEQEIKNRDSIIKQQHLELNRCGTRLDNLLNFKISPENKNGELLSDDQFIDFKRKILQDQALIREKIRDRESQNQGWFNLCSNYVDFNRNLVDKFKNASSEEKRDYFKFVYYNPVLRAKTLINTEESPYKFLISYNQQKAITITQDFGEDKNKKGVDTPNLLLMRDGRDSDPRPLP